MLQLATTSAEEENPTAAAGRDFSAGRPGTCRGHPGLFEKEESYGKCNWFTRTIEVDADMEPTAAMAHARARAGSHDLPGCRVFSSPIACWRSGSATRSLWPESSNGSMMMGLFDDARYFRPMRLLTLAGQLLRYTLCVP
jgi:hypothetical protein